jgi:hypothetical protein
MDRFNVVANRVRVRLVGLADWLYGCSHRRMTFPMTLRANVSRNGQQSAQADTYVVCLECGRHFTYDWTAMCIAEKRAEGLVPQAVRSWFRREAEANRGSR